MTILVISEHNNQQLYPATKHALSAALELDQAVHVLVVGSGCRTVAEQAAALTGVEKVILVDNACYTHMLAENMAKVIAALAPSFSHIMTGASSFGKSLMPRVAALLDVAQLSDMTRILSPDTFEHPIYAGNAIETVRMLDAIKVLTVRTTAFDMIASEQALCEIETVDMVFDSQNTRFKEYQYSESTRPELTDAKIVVSGGRGLQSAEKFGLIDALADVLGAAVGASRAAVDAGFVSNDFQVGQTGKVVAPALYFAIGISGAVQHLAGMKDAKTIVAINKDEDAPIMEVADYYLVGDLFTIVPDLIEQLKAR